VEPTGEQHRIAVSEKKERESEREIS